MNQEQKDSIGFASIWVALLLTILLAVCLSFRSCVNTIDRHHERNTTEKADTFVGPSRITATSHIEQLRIEKKSYDIPKLVFFKPTKDTIFVPKDTFLIREERTYQDSTYTARVSGIDPRLDYIETYNQIRTIRDTTWVERQITITRTKKKNDRFSLGLQATYGLTPDGKAGWVIGIGGSYKIIGF